MKMQVDQADHVPPRTMDSPLILVVFFLGKIRDIFGTFKMNRN